MVSVQIRDIPEQVRDTLADVARSRGQSMQTYLRNLLEEDARRAGNIAMLQQLRSIGGGERAEAGAAAEELDAVRNERDRRNRA